MTPLEALTYSFFFGLLHGILPDEHTWPITFSYAMGGATGKAGMKSSLYFSLAFTLQRMLVSELAYLALAPFLLLPVVNGTVYAAAGLAMFVAGTIVLRQNRYLHLHFVGHHHDQGREIETTRQVLGAHHTRSAAAARVPPARWTLVHGFIAGFGFGGFALFVNTVASPAMTSPWLGFLPGLAFGLGTTITLVAVGGLLGASLRWSHLLTQAEVQRIGSQTGGRTLFFGGLLFAAAGIATLLGLDRYAPIDPGNLLIGLFMIGIALPAFVYSAHQVLVTRGEMDERDTSESTGEKVRRLDSGQRGDVRGSAR